SSPDKQHPLFAQKEPPRPVCVNAAVDGHVGQEAVCAYCSRICFRRVADRALPSLNIAEHQIARLHPEKAVVAQLGAGLGLAMKDALTERVDANQAILLRRLDRDYSPLELEYISDSDRLERGHHPSLLISSDSASRTPMICR